MEYVGVRVTTGSSVTVGNIVGAVTNESKRMLAGVPYVLQFKIVNYTSVNILDYIVYIKENLATVLSNNLDITKFSVVNTFTDEGVNKKEYLCYIFFEVPTDGFYRFGICRKLVGTDKVNTKLFDIREVSCEKGTMLPEYKDNSEDYQEFMTKTETYFKQTNERISMMAKKDDLNLTNALIEATSESILLQVEKKTDSDSIISTINMSPEEIQIKAEKVNMTGALNLNGTFTCYSSAEKQSGNYLYQAGAVHRGYLAGKSNPTFSSGIWNPDGTNYMGYVSVGLTNSDKIDSNGCLWMSPESTGGAHLYYSRLLNGSGVFSGMRFGTDGKVNYSSFMTNKTTNNYYSHIFDGGISCYSISGSDLTCGSIGCTGDGTLSGTITVKGYSYLDSNVRINNQLYTTNSQLWFGAGGLNAQYMLTLQSDGYFLPKGGVQLGTSNAPFWQLVCSYAPSVVSDARKKENISYIKSNTDVSIFSLEENSVEENITIDDMYNYIKDIPLVTYNLKQTRSDIQSKRQIGFLAQDIMETTIGNYIVDVRDEDNLSYDLGNRVSVLEGALKKAIEKIEILQNEIDNSK